MTPHKSVQRRIIEASIELAAGDIRQELANFFRKRVFSINGLWSDIIASSYRGQCNALVDRYGFGKRIPIFGYRFIADSRNILVELLLHEGRPSIIDCGADRELRIDSVVDYRFYKDPSASTGHTNQFASIAALCDHLRPVSRKTLRSEILQSGNISDLMWRAGIGVKDSISDSPYGIFIVEGIDAVLFTSTPERVTFPDKAFFVLAYTPTWKFIVCCLDDHRDKSFYLINQIDQTRIPFDSYDSAVTALVELLGVEAS